MEILKIGRVYKIVNKESNITYIGSTFLKLNKRWRKHKNTLRKGGCSIALYLQIYGIENFNIELIKEYNVVCKMHLRAYEQLWMNKLTCINKQQAIPSLYKYMNDKQKILCSICNTYGVKGKVKRHRRSNKHRTNLKQMLKLNLTKIRIQHINMCY